MKKITFNVESFRRIPNPHGNFLKDSKMKAPEMFTAIVNVKNVPEDIPTQTNPREQNMRTKVAKRIKEGLLSNGSSFLLLNRGILLSASDVKFDNINSKLSIFIDDENVHGNVDGGHTYRTILEFRDELEENNDQYVKLEILTGIEDVFEDVAAARNTSVQVQDKAIAELKQKFDIVKTSIKDEPFSENIAYKENEEKDIDVSDILTILYMFNIDKLPGQDKMPTSAYSSKFACIKSYIDDYDKYANKDNNPYYKMRYIMPEIFKLHDLIESNMGEKYKEGKSSGKYGSTKGVIPAKTDDKFYSKFYKKPMEHKSPRGFIYPILGAFRALVKEEDGVYQWIDDPIKYFNEIGKDLVVETVERSRSLGNNPNAVGKDSGHWKQLYQNVLTKYLISKVQ